MSRLCGQNENTSSQYSNRVILIAGKGQLWLSVGNIYTPYYRITLSIVSFYNFLVFPKLPFFYILCSKLARPLLNFTKITITYAVTVNWNIFCIKLHPIIKNVNKVIKNGVIATGKVSYIQNSKLIAKQTSSEITL